MRGRLLELRSAPTRYSQGVLDEAAISSRQSNDGHQTD